MCHDEHLHYLRVREWRDLYSQLRQVAGQLQIRPTVESRSSRSRASRRAGRIAVAHGRARRRRPRVPGCPRRPVRDRPRLGADAPPASMGDGRRAGRDEPAVGPPGGRDPARVGRAAGATSGQALVRRPVVGRRGGAGGGRRNGHAVRPADRAASERSASIASIGGCAGEMFVRHALVFGDWETPPRVRRPQRPSSSSGSGCSRHVCGGSICSTTRPCSSSTTSASAGTSRPHGTSIGGGATLVTATRTCSI